MVGEVQVEGALFLRFQAGGPFEEQAAGGGVETGGARVGSALETFQTGMEDEEGGVETGQVQGRMD